MPKRPKNPSPDALDDKASILPDKDSGATPPPAEEVIFAESSGMPDNNSLPSSNLEPIEQHNKTVEPKDVKKSSIPLSDTPETFKKSGEGKA